MTQRAARAEIRSMTGFGRATFEVEDLAFVVEVRSVNHRHLDLRLKLPRLIADCETALRARVRQALGRGKVDLNISPASGVVTDNEFELQVEVAKQYVDAARQLGERFGVSNEIDTASLLGMPGVIRFVDRGLDEKALNDALFGAVDQALDAMDAMRSGEGQALAAEFASRLERILELVESLEGRSGLVLEAAKNRLQKRAEQLRPVTGIPDEARLHQEIVIAADRLDIREELVRLRSHVEQFIAVLGEAGREHPVGRRLDFLLQELGREANTVGSKANDAPLAHDVVELKTELERVREQVQNIE